MGIIGDFESLGSAFVDGITGDSGQPQYAPSPAVGSAPPGPVEPAQTPPMPDASGSGQITVHRDVLRSVATRMHADVAELDAAVQQVRAAGSSLGSFSGWSTGSAFGGNVLSACSGFGQVGASTSDTQSTAAKNLTDSASGYDEAESKSRQAVGGVNSTLDSSASSVSSASGIG